MLHGGPGARGAARGLAAGIAADPRFRVLEPWQRRSGGAPLTVAAHVGDLDRFVAARLGERPFALVGHSWGAMLALSFAAAHPGRAAAMVLVGCGTYDERSRRRMETTRLDRLGGEGRARLAALADEIEDPDERLRAAAEIVTRADAVDPMDEAFEELREPGAIDVDARSGEETWADVLARQRDGVEPASFRAIRGPTLMFHGADDPHPGARIFDVLVRTIPRLDLRELPACGHTPWWERRAREPFLEELRARLAAAPLEEENE